MDSVPQLKDNDQQDRIPDGHQRQAQGQRDHSAHHCSLSSSARDATAINDMSSTPKMNPASAATIAQVMCTVTSLPSVR